MLGFLLLFHYFLWYNESSGKGAENIWLVIQKIQKSLRTRTWSINWIRRYPHRQNGSSLYKKHWKQTVWKMGVPLSRATLANWIIYCAENYLCHCFMIIFTVSYGCVNIWWQMRPGSRYWMSRGVIRKRIPGCGSSAVGKMDFRRSCSTITQRQGQSSMQHLSYRGSADVWRRMDTRVIIICRISNAALAGHMWDVISQMPYRKGKSMITAFRRCREYSSAPNCLIVRDTQKQKTYCGAEKTVPSWKGEADTGCILELAGSTAPKQRNPFGESGELCPKIRKGTLMTYLEDGQLQSFK